MYTTCTLLRQHACIATHAQVYSHRSQTYHPLHLPRFAQARLSQARPWEIHGPQHPRGAAWLQVSVIVLDHSVHSPADVIHHYFPPNCGPIIAVTCAPLLNHPLWRTVLVHCLECDLIVSFVYKVHSSLSLVYGSITCWGKSRLKLTHQGRVVLGVWGR